MPKAAFCSQCGTHVWVSETGDCANGHPRSALRDEYEVAAPMPAPPATHSIGVPGLAAPSSQPSLAKPNPWKYVGWGFVIYLGGSVVLGIPFAVVGIPESLVGLVAALGGTFWALTAYYKAKYLYLLAMTTDGGAVAVKPNVWKYITIGMLIWVVGGIALGGVLLAGGQTSYGSGFVSGAIGGIYSIVAYNRAKCAALVARVSV